MKTLKTRADRVGQRADSQRLGQPRDTLEEHMAVGEETNEESVDEDFLPHHHAGDFIDQGLDPLATFLDLLG